MPPRFPLVSLFLILCLSAQFSAAFAEEGAVPWSSSVDSNVSDLKEQETEVGECSLGEASSPSCGFFGEESEEISRVVPLEKDGTAPVGYELVEFQVPCKEQEEKRYVAGTVVRVGAEYKLSRNGKAKRSILVKRASLAKVEASTCQEADVEKATAVVSVLLSQKDEREIKVIRGIASLFLEPASS